jgi:DNA-binding FadR family transcriptional regulator
MPRAQFFRELFEIRRMIEPRAAVLAAERADAADIDEMTLAYAAMEVADQTTDVRDRRPTCASIVPSCPRRTTIC